MGMHLNASNISDKLVARYANRAERMADSVEAFRSTLTNQGDKELAIMGSASERGRDLDPKHEARVDLFESVAKSLKAVEDELREAYELLHESAIQ